jgi:hypothetical protein
MASFTVDSIREKAAQEYASTDIELNDGTTAVLLNPLRLSKAKRKKLMSIQDDLETEEGEEEKDQEDVLADAIRLVAETKEQGTALLKEFGGDLAALATIFSLYTESTQVGEASASQS